jgi:hypothetical protein
MNRLNAFSLLLAGALLVTATPALAGGDGLVSDFTNLGVPLASDGCGDEVASVADISAHTAEERIRNQHVNVDEDDVLLAIALRNNGAGDIDWNDIRDVDLTKKMRVTARQDTDFERETVFSALALGVHDGAGGSLGALACVADLERSEFQLVRFTRDVDLTENNVLLAIALANGGGGGNVDFGDIADINERLFAEDSVNQDVDIQRDDAFLALALGAGQ